jgi:S-DNA-T family DNA segregation ATPase FtsK/SpoIIIE
LVDIAIGPRGACAASVIPWAVESDMAKKQRQTKSSGETSGIHRHHLAWALLAGVWLMLAAALISHHPADFPGHQVWPINERPANWIGKFGAIISYKLYLMIGPGVWVAMAAAAAGLVRLARKGTIDQLLLRVVGVALTAVSVSAMIGLTAPEGATWLTLQPQGAGGLLAIFINAELLERFNTLGTLIVLLVGFWVGALLAADDLVMLLPRALGAVLTRITKIRVPRPVLVGALSLKPRGVTAAPAPRPHRVPVRGGANDDLEAEEPIDEDAGTVAVIDELPQVQAVIDEDDEDDQEVEAHDAPGAYIDEKQPFDPEALREKIRKMPINIAAPGKGKDKTHPAGGEFGEMDLRGYQFPGLDVLEEVESSFTEEIEQIVREQAVALESALQEYRIEGEVVGIDSGPVITLYEVRLAPGTKVSRINTVSDDLARALKSHNIRVVPTMVGKDTIGIEVPNVKKEKVRLKELMTINGESTAKMKLPMFLGKDASGNPLIADLTQMPHMLIAGTTGSGKSVCMNSIIMSFLFTRRPDELKLVLVDPKMVEMSLFRDVPHLMCPVVTEMSKAAAILEWAVTKMDERYELLAEAGVRDIAGYNQLTWEEICERMQPADENEEARIPKKLPYMVFVIDELADLMITNKEVEHFIVRIAQKARAVGIHLIVATQRPQANVVTGLIKGNMPCRVSFKVASRLDSRIVLDQPGAEVLLGQGDMLYLSPRTSKLIRAQGSLVEDGEIRRTVKFLKDISQQHFEPQLVQLKSASADDVNDEAAKDELFEDAVRVVLESQRGSVSLLQRRLTIGYSRSSRLIEAMAAAGILGDHKGSQAREVMLTLDEWEAMRAQAAADAQDEAGDYEEEDADVPDEYDDEYRS